MAEFLKKICLVYSTSPKVLKQIRMILKTKNKKNTKKSTKKKTPPKRLFSELEILVISG